jgi:hypothetical protein
MEFGEWLAIGMKQNWVSEPFCETHDGGPHTDPELDEFEEGGDPCIVHLRVWYGV